MYVLYVCSLQVRLTQKHDAHLVLEIRAHDVSTEPGKGHAEISFLIYVRTCLKNFLHVSLLVSHVRT